MDIFFQSDNLLTVDEVFDVAAEAYINTATVTATVVDPQGTEIPGETWPITLTYEAGSNGKYQATIADTVSFTEGQSVNIQVTIDGGPGLKAYCEGQAVVRTKSF